MSFQSKWNWCVVGNIIRPVINPNGSMCYGSHDFRGGRKVYLCGHLWSPEYETIGVLGFDRNHKLRYHDVPVTSIENVRLRRVYKSSVVFAMNCEEFQQDWWHDTPGDRSDAVQFLRLWKEVVLASGV